MLRNYLYYSMKPLLPEFIRMGVRRWFAVRKRAQVNRIWPIKLGTQAPPPGWPGWPNGKRFAVVLTHDVEGPRGLNRCPDVIKLEMNSGFRSVFNFIPE